MNRREALTKMTGCVVASIGLPLLNEGEWECENERTVEWNKRQTEYLMERLNPKIQYRIDENNNKVFYVEIPDNKVFEFMGRLKHNIKYCKAVFNEGKPTLAEWVLK